MSFRLQLAEELIGSFSSQKRAGRRRYGEHSDTQRVDPGLGHWPQESPTSRCCIVCSAKKFRAHIARFTSVCMEVEIVSRTTTLW